MVAELDCEINQIKAANIEGMLTSEGAASQATFYWHLATYLTARVRQLTAMVGESLASRGSEVSLEEVLSNAVFFSIFQKYLAEHKLVDGKVLPFMQELNSYLDCATGALTMARDIAGKYLVGEGSVAANKEVVALISAQLAKEEPPPRDLFTPVLAPSICLPACLPARPPACLPACRSSHPSLPSPLQGARRGVRCALEERLQALPAKRHLPAVPRAQGQGDAGRHATPP